MKKFSIKKPNLIANVGNFLPVWLFCRSSGGNIARKQLSKGTLPHHSDHGFDR